MPATTALLTFFHLSIVLSIVPLPVPFAQDGQAHPPRPDAQPAEARGGSGGDGRSLFRAPRYVFDHPGVVALGFRPAGER